MKNNILRLGGWLKTNKIWFETLAAVLLSLAAILVSVLQLHASTRQNAIADKQSDLLAIQIEIAKADNTRQEREDALSKQVAWYDLRDLCRQILKEFQSLPLGPGTTPDDYNILSERMSGDEMIAWLDRVVIMWAKLGRNRIITENPEFNSAYMKCQLGVQLQSNIIYFLPPYYEFSSLYIKHRFPDIIYNMHQALMTIIFSWENPLLVLQN